MTMARKRKIRQIIVIALLILVIAWLVFPFLWMLSTAFKPPEEIFTEKPRWIPLNPTTQNFFHICEFGHGSLYHNGLSSRRYCLCWLCLVPL